MGLISAPHFTKQDVLSKIDSEIIFTQYHGPFEPRRKAYHSPFRRDDSASCIFYEGKNGYKFRDLAHPEEDLDCFAFVGKLYGLSYKDAVSKVAKDFGLDGGKRLFNITQVRRRTDKEREKKETIIEVVPDLWGKAYLSYWSNYGITQEELDKNGVYPVKFLTINGKEIPNYSLEMRFCYEVYWDGITYYKIYTPHAEKKAFKWISNVPIYLLFGLNSLPYADDRLIIAKGNKDRILLKQYFSDVAACQNESTASLRDKTIDYFKSKYKTIYYHSDCDEAGIAAAEYFEKKGLIPLVLPEYYLKDWGAKDISDTRKILGKEGVEQFLKSKNLLK